MKRNIKKRKYVRKNKASMAKLTDYKPFMEMRDISIEELKSHYPSYLNRDKATEISPDNSGGLARIEQAALKFELAINAAIERLNKLV